MKDSEQPNNKPIETNPLKVSEFNEILKKVAKVKPPTKSKKGKES